MPDYKCTLLPYNCISKRGFVPKKPVTHPPRETTSLTLTRYDTRTPRTSLLHPSLTLHREGTKKEISLLACSIGNINRHTLLTNMVLEARLVSSCLSLPSRARPRFSRLLFRVGVRVYTLQNVELDDTWSLKELNSSQFNNSQ